MQGAAVLTPDQLEAIADAWLNAERLSASVRDGTLPPIPQIYDVIKAELALLIAVGIHREGRA